MSKSGAELVLNGSRIEDGSYIKIGLHYPIVTQEDKSQAMEKDVEKADFLIDLVKRSRRGDLEAMEGIYEHYKRPIFNLIYRHIYNRDVAEDLLQDIFVKVFTHMHTLQRNDTFSGWVYRIALNTCYSYLRGTKSQLQKTVSLSDVEGTIAEKIDDYDDTLMRKPLEEAIQKLPHRLKSIFLLHDVQGFKHEEISQILGCSVGTSKSQLFKARMKIRGYLKNKQNQ
ncbi:MAG: RNA polymerase sigma factor [Candidatus Aminicenantes bacterium]|nr:MAG: RNA polymerase sigma factor [Candidatus Aminicenantes bacterium]